MFASTDGRNAGVRRRPGMGVGHHCSLGRGVLLTLLSLAILPAGPAADVLGGGGPPLVAPFVSVAANQAVRLADPEPWPAAAEGSLTSANRPFDLAAWAEEEAMRLLQAEEPVPPPPPPDSAGAMTREADAVADRSAATVQLAEFAGPPEKAKPEKPAELFSIRGEDKPTQQLSVAVGSALTLDSREPLTNVAVSDPEVVELGLEEMPLSFRLYGKKTGMTRLLVTTAASQAAYTVVVELDLSRLEALIKRIAPTARVQPTALNGAIVLRGTVPDIETAQHVLGVAQLFQGEKDKVIDQLRVGGGQQTMLRVVVAEINREALRELGVNWAIGGSDWSRDFFFANNLGGLNPTQFGSSGLNNVLLAPPAGQQIYSVLPVFNDPAATNVTFGFPRAEFQMFMNALRQNSLSKVLAEPNLVAISGQTARFLAGGEVPFPVAQSSGTGTGITIEYKEFGVRLAFTPTVIGGQMIRLHVMSEVSEVVPGQQIVGGYPIFTFSTRRAESTFECGSGQTFAMAGMLSENVRAVAGKIPGLGDVPVLGTLFSSTEYRRSVTELVILVTPQLVEPLDPQQVPPPPGSLVTEPDDFELFALQKLEGRPLGSPLADRVPREQAPVNAIPAATHEWGQARFAVRGPCGFAESIESN